MSLDRSYHDLIDTFRHKFVYLQSYTHEYLDDGVEVGISWKVHALVCHLGQWLDQHPRGLGIFL